MAKIARGRPRKGSIAGLLGNLLALRGVGEGAQIKDGALGTLGPAGNADVAPVEYEQVRELRPAVGRPDLHQCLLDLRGVAQLVEAKPSAHAAAMGIHHDAL